MPSLRDILIASASKRKQELLAMSPKERRAVKDKENEAIALVLYQDRLAHERYVEAYLSDPKNKDHICGERRYTG